MKKVKVNIEFESIVPDDMTTDVLTTEIIKKEINTDSSRVYVRNYKGFNKVVSFEQTDISVSDSFKCDADGFPE
ncbi:MAG: hypothetical protein LIP05_10220 [Tannerellaceae bacterium]|nr:hypothetical protein [Tannerellaceae bacterium]